MSETKKKETSSIDQSGTNCIPEFRRDIFPTNIALSPEDICELSKIIFKANEKAVDIELRAIEEGAEDAKERSEHIKYLMQIEYTLRMHSGDNIQGLGIPKEVDFPERLMSFFISCDTFALRAINRSPLNHINAFLSFDTPSLKIDLVHLPSNPTENRSVINIVGRDENWVRATADQLNEFFKKRKTLRPVIHGSGVYDLFLYLVYLPIFLGLLFRYDESIFPLLSQKSTLFNILLGIYLFFVILIIARMIFQLVRWLLPPIEYYKSNYTRGAASALRAIIGLVLTGLFVSALYDFGKFLLQLAFG